MPSYPPTSLPPEAQASVRQYELRVIELLESCADHQRHDPEVFLWNARRALEAICHLLITVHKKQTSRAEQAGKESKESKESRESSLDGMIKKLQGFGVLDREQFPRFEMARMLTNLGVHVQKPEREDYPAAVADVAHVLAGIVDWLYTGSPAASLLQRRKDLPAELIRRGGREGPSLKEQAQTARADKERADLALAEAKRQVAALERQVQARSKGQSSFGATLGMGLTAGLLLGLCAGGLGATLVAGGRDTPAAASASVPPPASAPPTNVVVSTTPTTPTPAPPAAPAPTLGPEGQTPAPLPTPRAGACPAGTLLVPTVHAMRLGQPEGARPGWPRPDEGRLDAGTVQAYCLDTNPRQRGASLPPEVDAEAVAACQRRLGPGELPAAQTCLTRDEAEAWCRATLTDGHLPGIEEWEAAARGRLSGLQLATGEWSGERFPPAVLGRSDPRWSRGDGMTVAQLPPGRTPFTFDGHLLLEWQQADPEDRDPKRGFRCASPAR